MLLFLAVAVLLYLSTMPDNHQFNKQWAKREIYLQSSNCFSTMKIDYIVYPSVCVYVRAGEHSCVRFDCQPLNQIQCYNLIVNWIELNCSSNFLNSTTINWIAFDKYHWVYIVRSEHMHSTEIARSLRNKFRTRKRDRESGWEMGERENKKQTFPFRKINSETVIQKLPVCNAPLRETENIF